ncbi:cell division protein FtsL [Marinobacterium sp. D7]|uniref:cell division protein FtsL n=1 Tax=Marinobacterium ramblicola TaxID=2849041 RepID=UPI001C2D3C9D|nr:cell division protein FtsL [Marinobacterium ramblicola]MBV1787082.1 cell division protein FtsL [Marinobacterium ramblicola]
MNIFRQRLERVKAQFIRSAQEPEASNRVTAVRAAPEKLLGAADLVKPAGVMAVMIALVLVSALMVIYSAYEYRNLFNRHQVLSSQGDELQVEWGQLLLEESAWSANNRVETQAEKKLDMRIPEAKGIEIVRNESR